MEIIRVLWIDDEIELLKPHILFLQQKGYEVETMNNGFDAVDRVREVSFDLVFLDENMPGMGGLEVLQKIKAIKRHLPVVMVTKSEEESIMEDAIGSQISDYLIKPVNPNQLLLSLKKNLDKRRLVNEKTTLNYQQEFRKIGMELNDVRSWDEWTDLYKKLVYWELSLEKLEDKSMEEILIMQKREANSLFFRFIEDTYPSWFGNNDAPIMSHNLFAKKVFPLLSDGKPTFLLLMDNLRYDQWKVIESDLQSLFRTTEESLFCSILPTATQYARNAMFAGLMPDEIKRRYKDKWIEEGDEDGKNLHEAFFLTDQLNRAGLGHLKHSYHKVTQLQYGKKLVDQVKELSANTLNVIVYNFVDMLSHSKTEMEVIKELADNDRSYRSLTKSWFKNSPLMDIARKAAELQARVIITTDHGTINVTQPSKLVGERSLNTNLRYKSGKNISYEKKDVMAVKKPESIHMPTEYSGSTVVFAREDKFFAYPNNFNHYVKYYKNSYQHGGISLEEMVIPFAILEAR
jgi:CheY-like chemotaxis protein